MGWSKEEFWRSTPAEYFACLDRYEVRIKREDYRAGLIAATIVNIYQSKDAEQLQPFDFFVMHQNEKETFEYRKNRRNNAAQALNVMLIKARDKVEKEKKAGKRK